MEPKNNFDLTVKLSQYKSSVLERYATWFILVLTLLLAWVLQSITFSSGTVVTKKAMNLYPASYQEWGTKTCLITMDSVQQRAPLAIPGRAFQRQDTLYLIVANGIVNPSHSYNMDLQLYEEKNYSQKKKQSLLYKMLRFF